MFDKLEALPITSRRWVGAPGLVIDLVRIAALCAGGHPVAYSSVS